MHLFARKEERDKTSDYTFSVIIPAHNEEKYTGKCIEEVNRASEKVGDGKVQIIVSANRCTNKIVEIAAAMEDEVCENTVKCISAIRNDGARLAKGNIIVTIDADSRMTEDSLAEIKSMLSTGKFIVGGTIPRFDRMSLGIAIYSAYVELNVIPITTGKRRTNFTMTSKGEMIWTTRSV